MNSINNLRMNFVNTSYGKIQKTNLQENPNFKGVSNAKKVVGAAVPAALALAPFAVRQNVDETNGVPSKPMTDADARKAMQTILNGIKNEIITSDTKKLIECAVSAETFDITKKYVEEYAHKCETSTNSGRDDDKFEAIFDESFLNVYNADLVLKVLIDTDYNMLTECSTCDLEGILIEIDSEAQKQFAEENIFNESFVFDGEQGEYIEVKKTDNGYEVVNSETKPLAETNRYNREGLRNILRGVNKYNQDIAKILLKDNNMRNEYPFLSKIKDTESVQIAKHFLDISTDSDSLIGLNEVFSGIVTLRCGLRDLTNKEEADKIVSNVEKSILSDLENNKSL